jgi:ArsR family transcriptional regulator, arsenate/arsenite/antimonite-responsive transcriptional repressor
MDAEILKAVADPNRLQILKLLRGGERCLCDVSAALGMSDALASHHVKRLAAAGLVKTRRRGLWLYCSLDTAKLESLADDVRALSVLTPGAGDDACCGSRTARKGDPNE